MRILFICKHNRFRSKVAESIFSKLNKNKKIKAESGGILIDKNRPYVAENVIKIMKEKGYSIYGNPRQLHKDMISNYDLLVIAGGVEKEFFKDFSGRIIEWKIEDADESETEKIREIIDEIEKKVRELIDNEL